MKHHLIGLAFAGAGIIGGAAAAAQPVDSWTINGNVTLATDYRFRGVTLSDDNFAIQGSLGATHSSGLFANVWASSLSSGSVPVELDLTGGYGFSVGALSASVGAIGYFYPNADVDDLDYGEIFGSISGTAGTTGLSLGINYAPEQSGTGDQDNFYVFGSFSHPLTNNLSLNGLVGYEDGAFGNEKIDYSLGLSTTAAGLGISVSYVGFDADGADDDTVVATVGKSF